MEARKTTREGETRGRKDEVVWKQKQQFIKKFGQFWNEFEMKIKYFELDFG